MELDEYTFPLNKQDFIENEWLEISCVVYICFHVRTNKSRYIRAENIYKDRRKAIVTICTLKVKNDRCIVLSFTITFLGREQ